LKLKLGISTNFSGIQDLDNNAAVIRTEVVADWGVAWAAADCHCWRYQWV